MLNKVKKARALRKRVKHEKARLRARGRKSKRTRYILMTITGLEKETIERIKANAKANHLSVSKYVNRLLSKAVKEWNTKEEQS